MKETIKVEEDDLLNDALTYYKDSDFDPKKKLSLRLNLQQTLEVC